MNIFSRKTLFTAICTTTLAASALADKSMHGEQYFNRIATFPVFLNLADDEQPEEETVSEIVTATADGNTLIYTDSEMERIGFVSILDPSSPQPAGFINLNGEPTSVTVKGRYAFVAVNTSNGDVLNENQDADADLKFYRDMSGELVVVDLADRSTAATIPLTGQPDSVAVSPNGRYLAVVIENERDEEVCVGGTENAKEAEEDDDAAIDACENGGGDVGIPGQGPAGLLQIVDLVGTPDQWTTRDVDMSGYAAKFGPDPEPEFVDISRNNFAVVSLQENNHMLVVHLPSGTVSSTFPAGTVDLTDIDAIEDDHINPVDSLYNLPREPDAITWMGKNRIATANEGDLDGGSRGFTIFNKHGEVKYDSGNSFEHTAIRHGHYPEDRSENKGAEPEGIEYGVYGRQPYLFVGSERGNFVSVYKTGRNKVNFHQLLPTAVGPEGLLAIPGRNLFVTASEVDDEGDGIRSAIGIYQLQYKAPTYPSIKSTDDALIPWSALSGLAADNSDPHTLYTIRDSFYDKSAFYTVDVSAKPAVINEQTYLLDNSDLLTDFGLTNDDGTVNLDQEGITQDLDGNFWIASEGKGSTPNLLVKAHASGAIQQVVELPAEVTALQINNGFEGVAPINEDGKTVALLVAFQRNWTNDPADMRRIGKYDLATGVWSFAYYPAETPAKGWAGLSEITPLGGTEFAVIERDNQIGLDADANDLKRVYSIDIANIDFVEQGQAFPVLTKELMINMLPLMQATHGTTPDKLEGFAKTVDGRFYAVTDNDGLDDAYGETLFMRIPSHLCKKPQHRDWRHKKGFLHKKNNHHAKNKYHH